MAMVKILRDTSECGLGKRCADQLWQASVSQWQHTIAPSPSKLNHINEAFRQSPNTDPSGQPQVTSILQAMSFTKVLEKHNPVRCLGRSETLWGS